MKGAVIAAVAFVVIAGGWFAYRHFARGGGPISETARICAADFPEMPRELTEKRCACVVDALEKTEEGRGVLKLVLEHKQFLQMIESAASHASVLDAMNACGQ